MPAIVCCMLMMVGCANEGARPHQANEAASSSQGAFPSDAPAPEDPSGETPFVGMWNYDPAKGNSNALLIGVLILDMPCALVAPVGTEGEGNRVEVTTVHETRVFLKLPATQTRYDPVTQLVWVGTSGQMRDGDIVVLGGGYSKEQSGEQEFGGECLADLAFTASNMVPLSEYRISARQHGGPRRS